MSCGGFELRRPLNLIKLRSGPFLVMRSNIDELRFELASIPFSAIMHMARSQPGYRLKSTTKDSIVV